MRGDSVRIRPRTRWPSAKSSVGVLRTWLRRSALCSGRRHSPRTGRAGSRHHHIVLGCGCPYARSAPSRTSDERALSLRLVAAVAVVPLAAGCSSGARSPKRSRGTASASRPRRPPPPPRRPPRPRYRAGHDVTPKQAATALAHRLVGEAVLPPGARPSDAPLPEILRGPFETTAGGNIVLAHASATVPEDTDAVVSFVRAHVPLNLRAGKSGASGRRPSTRGTSSRR